MQHLKYIYSVAESSVTTSSMHILVQIYISEVCMSSTRSGSPLCTMSCISLVSFREVSTYNGETELQMANENEEVEKRGRPRECLFEFAMD